MTAGLNGTLMVLAYFAVVAYLGHRTHLLSHLQTKQSTQTKSKKRREIDLTQMKQSAGTSTENPFSVKDIEVTPKARRAGQWFVAFKDAHTTESFESFKARGLESGLTPLEFLKQETGLDEI